MEKLLAVRDQVFISYAHEDVEIVKKIYKQLCQHEINVWWDKQNRTSTELEQEISEEIEKSHFILFCLSKHSLRKTITKDSGFVSHELNLAIDTNLILHKDIFEILFLNLDDSPTEGMKINISIQFNLSDGFDDCMIKLTKYIKDTISEAISDPEIKIQKLVSKSLLLHYNGNNEEALDLLNQEALHKLGNYSLWNTKGAIFNNLNKPKEAIYCFNKAVRLAPKTFASLNNMGISYLNLGKYRKAIKMFDRVLSQIDTAHEAWVNKSRTLIDQGKLINAIEVAETGLTKVLHKKGKSKLWNIIGIAYLRSYDHRDLVKAEDAFHTAIGLDSNNKEAEKNFEIVYEEYQNMQDDIWNRTYLY